MTTTINQHGEKVTVIGTISDGRGGRSEVRIEEFLSCGMPCFALKGGFGGHPDARRFSTQMKRAKRIFSHPSMQAVWN